MYDFLVDNALRNVWCAPTQDRQAILQPARLTPDGGVVNSVQIDWSEYRLPVTSTAYHIYQIGQISPYLLGLLSWARTWAPFSVAMNRLNLIADLYVNSGIQLPRFQSYFMITRDRNILVAAQFQPTIDIDLDREPLCLRLYSNAFFQSPRATATTAGTTRNFVQTGGLVPKLRSDILPVQNTVQALKAQSGAVYCFVNGFKVEQINVVTAQPGDVIEYVYDSSICRVVDFPLASLPVFNSTLDSKYKYLLHPEVLHQGGRARHTIDYEDDIDVWIIYTLPSGITQGVFYHHNEADAIRNVTHRDYALPTAYVAGYLAARGNWDSEANVTIRFHIRKAGLERPLVYENNRIFELYKLSDTQIVSAMAGVNATLENWQAATLEASPYTRIMGAYGGTGGDISGDSMFDRQTVEDAYGYNATGRLTGLSPLIPVLESGQLIVSLPYNLQSNVTAWEYDGNGTLLGYYPHANGGVYVCQNSSCALVEVLYGSASQMPDDTYGQATQVIDTRLDYRMYTCDIAPLTARPLFNWTDVTGSSQYAIQDGILTWLIDTTKTYTCVRSNRTMLAYTLYIQPQEGILPIEIQQQGILNYVLHLFAMQIPMGQLDVFVNGRSMIQELDYVMKFPVIMINNIAALSFPQDRQQQITLRWTGFCNSDLSIPSHRDVGWVQFGLLSNNNRYNIRDDDVTRIVVGGGVFPKSALKCAEDDANILSPLPINGLPYQVQKVVVPMLGITNEDTCTYFDRALAIDRAVEDYMTLYYPAAGSERPGRHQRALSAFQPLLLQDHLRPRARHHRRNTLPVVLQRRLRAQSLPAL